ncbi:response regulator [Paenibacillus tarimensis]|uniref:response regulator n=1 Tax=Paenibacillus tarimensis TaxID=416012 RepID=UPI001F249758|nr:response regulator [Paenibacillus tarimensis]MCF2942716.1 response regulator [Paenibacillus tarimensis]
MDTYLILVLTVLAITIIGLLLFITNRNRIKEGSKRLIRERGAETAKGLKTAGTSLTTGRGDAGKEGPPSILIVDDQAAIRMLLAEVFQSSGLTVHEASSGKMAIEQFRDNEIDFVLLDLKMPDMDGLEALKEIRRIDPHVQTVMISAYGDVDKVETARKLGVEKFFTKPFDIEKLRRYVLQQLQVLER